MTTPESHTGFTAQKEQLSASGALSNDMDVSRSGTIRSEETAADVPIAKRTSSSSAGPFALKKERSTSTSHDLEKLADDHAHPNVLANLPAGRKHFLTLCFCLAMVRTFALS